MVNKYYDSDCNFGMLDGKKIAIIGVFTCILYFSPLVV